MQLACLLEQVPGSVNKASGMLGSCPTLDDTCRVLAVREYVKSLYGAVLSQSNWRPGPNKERCWREAHRVTLQCVAVVPSSNVLGQKLPIQRHAAGEAMSPSSFPNRL